MTYRILSRGFKETKEVNENAKQAKNYLRPLKPKDGKPYAFRLPRSKRPITLPKI